MLSLNNFCIFWIVFKFWIISYCLKIFYNISATLFCRAHWCADGMLDLGPIKLSDGLHMCFYAFIQEEHRLYYLQFPQLKEKAAQRESFLKFSDTSYQPQLYHLKISMLPRGKYKCLTVQLSNWKKHLEVAKRNTCIFPRLKYWVCNSSFLRWYLSSV